MGVYQYLKQNIEYLPIYDRGCEKQRKVFGLYGLPVHSSCQASPRRAVKDKRNVAKLKLDF